MTWRASSGPILGAAGIAALGKGRPLFQAGDGAAKRLGGPLNAATMWRVVKRLLGDAGLPSRLSPHSFRVSAITDLLTQGVPLQDMQYLAGHAEPRTTVLYDRRKKKVTRNTAEPISIYI